MARLYLFFGGYINRHHSKQQTPNRAKGATHMGWAKYDEDNRRIREERAAMIEHDQAALPIYRWKYVPNADDAETIPGIIQPGQKRRKRIIYKYN